MSRTSAVATLIIVSILSRRPGVCVATRRCSDEMSDEMNEVEGSARDERTTLESALCSAVVALSVAFAVASTVPPSSLALLRDRCISESSEDVFQDCADSLPQPTVDSDSAPRGLAADRTNRDETEKSRSSERVYPIVGCDTVKTPWTRRTRQSRASKAKTLFQQFQQATSNAQREPPQQQGAATKLSCELRSTPELGEVPGMMRCDSLVSSLSSDVSISSRSTLSCRGLSSRKETRKALRSSRHNDERAILE